MHEVSLFRLNILRAMYLLVAAGLGLTIWPLLLGSATGVEHMRGVVWSLLAGVSLLALVGLRYPLRMLPLLLFELVWKIVWVLAIGLPLWSGGRLQGASQETFTECLLGLVLLPAVIPWPYVLSNYVRQPGDRWWGKRGVPSAAE
jgi:hypothetical protein